MTRFLALLLAFSFGVLAAQIAQDYQESQRVCVSTKRVAN